MPNQLVSVEATAQALLTGWTVVGTAAALTAITDSSDATYLEQSPTAAFAESQARFDMADPTIPAGAKIVAIWVYMDVSDANAVAPKEVYNNTPTVGVYIVKNGRPYSYWAAWTTAETTIFRAGWPITTRPYDQQPWTSQDVNDAQLRLQVFQQTPNRKIRVYRARWEVEYNERPTVTVTGPSGNVATPRPTVVYTFSDVEADPQVVHNIHVYSSAQYNAAGFDPSKPEWWETSSDLAKRPVFSAVWETSGFGQRTIDVDLVNSTVYRVFVQVGQQWHTGLAGHMSALSAAGPYSEFTVSLTPLATPSLTVAPEPASALGPRVRLDLADLNNLLTANQASLETDTTGWAAEANTTIARTTAQAADGSASLSLTSPASGAGPWALRATTPTGTAAIPGLPNTQYTGLTSFRSAATARSARPVITWYDSAGNSISNAAPAFITTTTTGWTQQAITATSPSNAAYARLRVEVDGVTANSEVHYADKMSLHRGDSTTWAAGTAGTLTTIVEISDDAGTNWRSHPRLKALTGANAYTVYDYELPAGTSRRYRARQVSADNASEFATSIDQTLAFAGWWLKDVKDPARNTRIRVNYPLARRQREDQGVFWPVGRTTPVVVTGDIRSVEGSLELGFPTASEWTAFKTLRGGQRTLLLQNPAGGQTWIRLGSDLDETVLADRADAAPREATIGFVEVDAPL